MSDNATTETATVDSKILLAQSTVRQQINSDKYIAGSNDTETIETDAPTTTNTFSIQYDDVAIAAYHKLQYRQETDKIKLKQQQKMQETINHEKWISIKSVTYPTNDKVVPRFKKIDLANLNSSSVSFAADLDKTYTYKQVGSNAHLDLKQMRFDGHDVNRTKTEEELVQQYKKYKNNEKPRWFTRHEIENHNYRHDCWVVIFRKVYDVTQLIQDSMSNENPNQHENGLLIRPLLNAAGTDISHWFDEYSMNVKTYIDPISERRVPYLPYGRFLHVPPNDPTTDWSMNEIKNKTDENTDELTQLQWWKDWKYVVGLKTAKDRKIKVFNTLTKESNILSVCKEETLNEIQEYRYMFINKHCGSYTWKYQFTPLDMTKTLSQNNVCDDEELLQQSGTILEEYPTIYIYFNDDFTVA